MARDKGEGARAMGEYARYAGRRVKIGTCESMYYLRADQAHSVGALEGNVDPVADKAGIRFRFPFPFEDGTEPGDFDHPLPEVVVNYPAELVNADVHGTVSVQNAGAGSLRLSAALPCPTVAPEIWHQYVRTYRPRVRIAYQGYRGDDGDLAVIVECAYCDGMWWLPAPDAELLAVSIRSEADALAECARSRREDTLRRHGPDVGDPLAESEARQAAGLHGIADRILAGYRIGG